MSLGKCPYCDDGQIEVRKKDIRGKKVELYACSNAQWQSEDGEFFELTSDSSCGFRIWQNALAKYGHWFRHKEIRALLNGEDLMIEFRAQNRFKTKYEKAVILHPEYGVEILFN